MKQYYNVTFQYSESVFCSNLTHAESTEAVEGAYSKYGWCAVSPASSYDVEEAGKRGKLVIEL